MSRIQKISLLGLAKFQAVVMAYIGLIAGTLYSVGGAIYDVLTTGSVNLGTALAFFALIGMPAISATAGFFIGVIVAPLYNLTARSFGGIEFDLARN